jgi:hypothetical protein
LKPCIYCGAQNHDVRVYGGHWCCQLCHLERAANAPGVEQLDKLNQCCDVAGINKDAAKAMRLLVLATSRKVIDPECIMLAMVALERILEATA